jgi:hypothetical protein
LKGGGGVVIFLTPKAKDYKIGEKNVYIKKSYRSPSDLLIHGAHINLTVRQSDEVKRQSMMVIVHGIFLAAG